MKKKLVFRTQYDTMHEKPGLKFGPGKTQPHHAEEVDINNIVARFNRTGELPTRSNEPPQYLDLLLAPKSLQEAQERLIAARENFAKLPSAVRAEFRNSPVEFYDRVTRKDTHAMRVLQENGMMAPPREEKTQKPELKQEVKEQKAEPDAKQGT